MTTTLGRRAGLSPALAMAAGTLMSRATGLLRTAGLAAVLGVGLLSDAYTAASVVPTMLLVLVTGGTLSSALVPLLSRADDRTRVRAAGTALAAMAGLAAAAAVALAAAAPLLARLLSAGARGSDDYDVRVRVVTVLLVLIAPQVLLLAVTAVTSAVLTSRGRLGVVGWSPVATNVAFLAALAVYAAAAGSPSAREVGLSGLLLLGLGSTGATAVGCLLQYRAARALLPSWRAAVRGRDRSFLRDLRRTGGWTLLYAVANQVGLLVVLAVAARRNGVGSAYQWSFAVMQLPFALIGVTLLSATLPALARASGRPAAFDRLVRRASAPMLALLLPSAAGLALFAGLIADVLVGHGAAGRDGTALVAQGIALFSAALLPFAGYQLLTRTCYALDRPSWPALSNIAVNAVTVGGALLAAGPSSRSGVLTVLVLSYAASYVVGCLVLGAALARSGVAVAGGLLRPLLTSGGATVAGAAIVLALRAGLPHTAVRELAGVVAFAGAAAIGVLPWLSRPPRASDLDSDPPDATAPTPPPRR